MEPRVVVVAVTRFLGVPPELAPKGIREDQDQGSEAARLIECAGRTCYRSYGQGRDSAAYHQHIKESGHGSVCEHASISFAITGISRGCLLELTRHRVGVAFSVQSTRYVNEGESEWAWHPLVEAVRDGQEWQGLNALEADARLMYAAIGSAVEGHLQERGVDAATARKQARGAARGALANALSTALIFTANIRALRHFLEQRASAFADAEIRLLANALYCEARKFCPEYLADYRREECPDGIGYALTTEHRKL